MKDSALKHLSGPFVPSPVEPQIFKFAAWSGISQKLCKIESSFQQKTDIKSHSLPI